MDKEEFHAVLKLVSGEEIFAKVCPCEEEDKTILILESPVTFETVNIRQSGIQAVRINPWLKMTDDPVLVMNINNVMTMTEVHDKHMIGVYNRFLKDKDRVSNQANLDPNMGFLSSISDARIFLEKLYKSNDNKSS
jgi:hypothetical protein|tara:strand:+ start:14 stop:421 length:408 start_codon:yes stop_codon:yes gene_type:complete